MKNIFASVFTFWFILARTTLQDELKTSLFSNLTTYNVNIPDSKFDFYSSMTFLTNQNRTSVFSPLCFDLNLHTQMLNSEFGHQYTTPAKNKILRLAKSYEETKDEFFDIINNIYFSSETQKTQTVHDSFFNIEIYNVKDSKYTFNKHKEWFYNKTKGIISTPLNECMFAFFTKIYFNVVYFNGLWLSPFEPKETKSEDFILSNNDVVQREFMNKEKYMLFKTVKTKDFDFQIVAIPYKVSNQRFSSSRHMVYLIPSESTVDAKNLWQAFYSSCEEGIYDMLKEMEECPVNLSIPKINNLESNLDLKKTFPELFKQQKSTYLHSIMKTYLQIDEKGTKAISIGMTCCVDGTSPEPIKVKANVPHIAFIYDSKIKRILFLLQDDGKIIK